MRSFARLLAILFATFAIATVRPVAAISVDSSTPGALRVARADGAVVEPPLRHTSATCCSAPPEATGRSPLDRLVRAIGQSHLSPMLNPG